MSALNLTFNNQEPILPKNNTNISSISYYILNKPLIAFLDESLMNSFSFYLHELSSSQSNETDYEQSLNENVEPKRIPQTFIKCHNKNKNTSLNSTASSSECEENNQITSSTHNNDNKSNEIFPSNIILGTDKRTTVIIRNIPMKYTAKLLINELNNKIAIANKINYYYFSKSKSSNTNIAVINFINPLHIIYFYHLFHKKTLGKYNNKIIMSFLNAPINNNNNCNMIHIINTSSSCDNLDLLIPLQYMKLFKKVYSHSVCVVKEVNYCNEGLFIVKRY